MILRIGTTDKARNVIGKAMSNITVLDITLRSNFDISNPTILLEFPQNVNPLIFNYCEIVDLNRFYFIDSVESVNNKIWRFNMSCDVLETYKDSILASNARVRRKLKTGDRLSTAMEINIDADVTTHVSDKGFTGESSLILTTVGHSSSGA